MTKNNNGLQPKSASFAQKGRWKACLVRILSADLFWVLVVSCIIRAVYYSALLDTQAVDTASYLNYQANILHGETDAIRTPLYPYFIKLVALFGTKNLVSNVVTAQIVISFLTIIPFYKTVRTAFRTRKVTIAASLLYGALLPVINFDKIVLTESLSVAIMVNMLYLMVSYLHHPKIGKAVLLNLAVFLAVMLRPSFIYLLPVSMGFWVLRSIFVKNRKTAIAGLIASFAVVLLLCGYSNLNKKNFGFNGISLISNKNELTIITNAELYKNGNDPELSAVIKNNLTYEKSRQYTLIVNISEHYNPERVRTFIINCIKNEPVAYRWYVVNTLIKLQTVNIFTNYAEHKLNFLAFRIENIEYMVFCVTFNIVYLFLILDLVLIIIQWIKRKQVPWFRVILWMLIMGQITVAILGGYNEYQRLILPAIPCLLILLLSYIDKICFAIEPGRLKNYPSI